MPQDMKTTRAGTGFLCGCGFADFVHTTSHSWCLGSLGFGPGTCIDPVVLGCGARDYGL